MDDFEKVSGAFRVSGAVARRGVSGRKVILLLILLVGLFVISTTSRVGGTGVKDGSETRGTMLQGGGDVEVECGLNERLQTCVMTVQEQKPTIASRTAGI